MTTMKTKGASKRRFVMSIMPEDEPDLKTIIDHYRKQAGFEIKIAEIMRRLWKDEVARIRALH